MRAATRNCLLERGPALGADVREVLQTVHPYPTFSEAYKVAALDVMNKLRALSQFRV